MSLFSEISIDRKAGTATVGAGQRLGQVSHENLLYHSHSLTTSPSPSRHLTSQVYLELFKKANSLIPAGTCAGNGVSGFILGGGAGPFTRRLGWGSDSLVSVSAVTASGKLVVASERVNSDLFFAVRGGGVPPAAVYQFTFKMSKAPEKMAWCQAYWRRADAVSPQQQLADFLAAFNRWAPWDLPKRNADAHLYMSR